MKQAREIVYSVPTQATVQFLIAAFLSPLSLIGTALGLLDPRQL